MGVCRWARWGLDLLAAPQAQAPLPWGGGGGGVGKGPWEREAAIVQAPRRSASCSMECSPTGQEPELSTTGSLVWDYSVLPFELPSCALFQKARWCLPLKNSRNTPPNEQQLTVWCGGEGSYFFVLNLPPSPQGFMSCCNNRRAQGKLWQDVSFL